MLVLYDLVVSVDHDVVLLLFDPVFCCFRCSRVDVDDEAGQDVVARPSAMS